MRSSQESTLICSTLDCCLWEQQTLAQTKLMELSEHVHFYVEGWKCFTDVTTTSWDTCSMTCASCRLSWEYLSTSWSFCIFTCLLVSNSSCVLRLAFSFSSGSTEEGTLVAQIYSFSKFYCLPIKEVWECLRFSCSSFRAFELFNFANEILFLLFKLQLLFLESFKNSLDFDHISLA
jgi:hypothetical protein